MWYYFFVVVIPNTNAKYDEEYNSKYIKIKNNTIASIHENTTDAEKLNLITVYCGLFDYDSPTWVSKCKNDLTNEIIFNQTRTP